MAPLDHVARPRETWLFALAPGEAQGYLLTIQSGPGPTIAMAECATKAGLAKALWLSFALADVLVYDAHHLFAERAPDLLVLHQRVDEPVVRFDAADQIEVGLVIERVLELFF